MSTPTHTREIHLASRPHGAPTPENFRLTEVELPELAEGQVLVRNTVMSVDPYMRGRMNDVESYVPPFQLDAPLDGGAVGTVIASRHADVPEGTSVLHGLGWREHAVLDGDTVRDYDGVEVIVDKMSVPYLMGATIDFEDTISKQGFTIDNPNAGGSCACGDSFH